MFSWRHAREVVRMIFLESRKTATEGGPAPNGQVVDADGVTRRLLDFEHQSRPLVVVFGSCT